MHELESTYTWLNQRAYILNYANTVLFDDNSLGRNLNSNDPLKESLLDKEARAVNTTYFAGVIGRNEIGRFRTLLYWQTRGKAIMFYKDFGDPNAKNKELLSLYVLMF